MPTIFQGHDTLFNTIVTELSDPALKPPLVTIREGTYLQAKDETSGQFPMAFVGFVGTGSDTAVTRAQRVEYILPIPIVLIVHHGNTRDFRRKAFTGDPANPGIGDLHTLVGNHLWSKHKQDKFSNACVHEWHFSASSEPTVPGAAELLADSDLLSGIQLTILAEYIE